MTKRVLGHCSRWVQFADPAADVMHPKTRCIWSGAAITGSGSVGKSWELCRHFASDGELTIKLCLGGRIKRIVADLMVVTVCEKRETFVIDVRHACFGVVSMAVARHEFQIGFLSFWAWIAAVGMVQCAGRGNCRCCENN